MTTRPTVDAIEAAPGLLIYEVPSSEIPKWRIAHHSGLALAYCGSQPAAEAVVEEIKSFTDWTRSADEIRADKSLNVWDLSCRINYKTPGHFLATA